MSESQAHIGGMRTEELYFAPLPDPIRPGRFYKTRHKMLRSDIERRGGEVLQYSLELRMIAETDTELTARSPSGPCPAAPPPTPERPPVDPEASRLA